MSLKIKVAAVAALALAGLASGTMTSTAAPASTGGDLTIQAKDCQWLVIKRDPPASATATCRSLNAGYTKFQSVIECAGDRFYYGNAVFPNRISTATCPANTWMTSFPPYVLEL